MFSVFPNRKNYCLYFTVCDHFFNLPNVFSSNVKSSKFLIITELICSNAQRLELPKGSNFSKVRIARMLKCSICSMLKALPQKIAQKALCLVKIQNSKIQNCGKAATIQNSKFKNHPLTFSTSSMFLSNGPLCSSFSVHMAAANLPASVMLSPCERQ